MTLAVDGADSFSVAMGRLTVVINYRKLVNDECSKKQMVDFVYEEPDKKKTLFGSIIYVSHSFVTSNTSSWTMSLRTKFVGKGDVVFVRCCLGNLFSAPKQNYPRVANELIDR
jgi:hypothetical protein